MAVGGCRRPSPDPPAPVSDARRREWPNSVAEAVALKLRTMPETEKAAIRSSDRERVQDMYHGFQMLHRADFGLSEGNDALLASCGSISMTSEDCMRIILDALWVALQPPPRQLRTTAADRLSQQHPGSGRDGPHADGVGPRPETTIDQSKS